MVRLHVDIPDELHWQIAERAEAAGFADVGAYLLALAEDDRDWGAPEGSTFGSIEGLDHKLTQGLASPASPMTDEDWRHIRSEVSRRTGGTTRDAT